MEWNLLAGAQLLFFGLGAWYFWKSSRRKGAGEGLRCEDNIVEMDKLMAMEETKLTEPLAEQTRPRTLEEIRKTASRHCAQHSAAPIRSIF